MMKKWRNMVITNEIYENAELNKLSNKKKCTMKINKNELRCYQEKEKSFILT